MRKAQIIHNPTSGDGKHTKRQIIDEVSKTATVESYVSTDKDNWNEKLDQDVDLIFVAGGDGTFHKVANELVKEKHFPSSKPLFLLPCGTANNIARTFEVPKKIKDQQENLLQKTRNFDVGKIQGLKDFDLFFEGVGFGIFPELIKRMDEKNEEYDSTSEELKATFQNLLKIAGKFKARTATIEADGIRIEGAFLLVELINIKYIGPNFLIAPKADPGDGFFDLVLIPETKRVDLVNHLEKLDKNQEQQKDLPDFVQTLRVQKLRMSWAGEEVHVDDDLVPDYKGGSFDVDIDAGKLQITSGE